MKSSIRRIFAGAVFVLAFISSSAASAADATAFNPLTVSVEAQGISGVPVGTIIAWPVANNPEGWSDGNWLECNGQSISPTVYPELFAVVGGQVPDLRGLFLRGTGGNAAALGQFQGGAIPAALSGTLTWSVTGYIVGPERRWGNLNPQRGDASSGYPLVNTGTVDVTYTVIGEYAGPEVRPINRSVRYLMRAKP